MVFFFYFKKKEGEKRENFIQPPWKNIHAISPPIFILIFEDQQNYLFLVLHGSGCRSGLIGPTFIMLLLLLGGRRFGFLGIIIAGLQRCSGDGGGFEERFAVLVGVELHQECFPELD